MDNLLKHPFSCQFKELSTTTTEKKGPYESDSHAYYPLGSDGSSQRPISPRFTVEEVSSYEPVMFGRNLVQQKSPNLSKSPNLARAVMTKQMVKEISIFLLTDSSVNPFP